jgi:hypothetical protein
MTILNHVGFSIHLLLSSLLKIECLQAEPIRGIFYLFIYLCSHFSSLIFYCSELCGKKIRSEDDVLHLTKDHLPTFNGKISRRESELLLSYLTVPYLRIPLVMNFFAQPERILALGEPQLRHVLDCVLFEPGEWQRDDDRPEPKCIPAPDRRHLTTPVGLLFNELRFAAHGMIKPVLRIMELALELDSGKFVSTTGPIILYVARLLARIESYFLFMIEHHEWELKENRVNSVMAESYVRGLSCPAHVVDQLRDCCTQLRSNINKSIFPVLSQWLLYATRQDHNTHICVLNAHIALLLQNVPTEDFTREVVAAHICAQLVVNTRYIFKSEVF